MPTKKQDLAAQRSSQAHFSAPTYGRALRLPILWHLVPLLSWATAEFLALAFACFPCVGVGMEGSRGARACQCPQRINRDRFHLPLCLRGEYRLNAQRKMQGLVDAKTLADGFDDAEDDAIQKNGQEANQGQMQKEWAIYFPGCSPSPVWALLPAAK